MRRAAFPFPIRITVPAVLLVFGIVAGYASFRLEVRHTLRHITEHVSRKAAFTGSNTAGMLGYLYLEGSADVANVVVSRIGADPDVRAVLVADDVGTVLLSTDYALKGRAVSALLGPEKLDMISRAREAMRGSVSLHGKDTVASAYPFVFGSLPGEVRPSRTGVLYLEYDLSRARRNEVSEAVVHSMEFGAALVAMTGAMWFFFHKTLSARAARLVEATGHIAGGDFAFRSGLSGSDELAELSRALDLMAEEIRARDEDLTRARDELEAKVAERTSDLETANDRLLEEVETRRLNEKTLSERNAELEALYSVSASVSRTIDLDGLFGEILDAITGVEAFRETLWAGIFLLENGTMHLAARKGSIEAPPCAGDGIKVGECLCGLAAETGEVLISMNACEDPRHTNRYTGIRPHGHVVIPLRMEERVLGVLCLYLPEGQEVGERGARMLTNIGGQIGMAIEHSRLFEKTRELSLHDPLTGLANRRFMAIICERYFSRARRTGAPLSAALLDIDHFKEYNDTHGHAEGDRLLVEISRILKEVTRDADLVVRYGGEEFLVVFPDSAVEVAVGAAERIRETVAERTPVTVSLGVSSGAGGSSDMRDLVIRADKALYRAKGAGRNRVESS